MSAGAHTPMGSTHQVRGYTLRKFLAQGGMAELFLAQPSDPTRAQDIVVVKRVLPQFVQDQQFARMFAREASLASLLKHPNIVEVFDDEGAADSECFFAMEYVHGPDLNMLLKELKEGTRPVPLEHALEIAMGMCQGLHYAHEYRGEDGQLLSIVHRDVSPSNVMIGEDGVVKITDFGVAKALALTSFTQAGTRKGKLSYMSPEQAVADPVDRRTDIFAIGTVLFEMTTLQRMFGGENELAIMHKLLFRERPRPSAIRHDYPPELESIVLKAVAQKPDDRFDTAHDLYLALHDFAERRRLSTTPDRLARWVGSVIPPKPHPGKDPAFYTRHAHATVVPLQRDTVVAQDMQATVSDSGIDKNATVLDGGPMLAPVAGQLQSSAATQIHQHQPVAPPMAVPIGPQFASPTSPGTNPNIGRRPATNSSSTLPAIAIVTGALAVGAVILAGALWYADARKRPQPTPAAESTEAEVQPAPVAAPPEPALQPGVLDPDPPAPVVENPPEPAPSEEPAATPPEPAKGPAPEPAKASAAKPAKQHGKRRRPKAEPTPKTEPAPKPQPTPAPKPAPKHSRDDLVPM